MSNNYNTAAWKAMRKEMLEEANFKDYPFPNYMAGELLLRHYNEGNLAGIEADIVRVFALLEASSIVFNVGSVSAPSVLSIASGDLLTCDIAISTLTEWS